MPLFGKELLKKIQKRCRIQPGMLVRSLNSECCEIGTLALVVGLSPNCEFERDYEGSEDHIFYRCEPIGDGPLFVDYVCHLEQVL